jgi:hypothetical protein
MLALEGWLQLDRPHSRLFEVAGVVGVGVAGLAVMGGVLGLFSIGRLRRAADGTEVPLR